MYQFILIAIALIGSFSLGQTQTANQDSNLTLLSSWNNLGAESPVVVGEYLYCGSGSSLHILNISNPDSIAFIREVPAPETVQRLVINGNHAFLAVYNSSFTSKTDSSGLFIVDISNPEKAQATGFLELNDIPVLDVTVQGQYAFLACYDSGLYVVDISDLTNPQLVQTFKTAGYASYVTSLDNKVYVGLSYVNSKYSGFQIIDVSNPTNPVEAGFFTDNKWYNTPRTIVDGNYLYYCNGNYGVSVYDVSTPSSPALVSTLTPGGDVKDVFIDNGLAYVQDSYGITIYDVTDHANPQKKGLYYQGNLKWIFVANQRAYSVYSNYFGSANQVTLHLIDVSNPDSPSLLTTYGMRNGTADALFIKNNLAFVTYLGFGIIIIDISDILNPHMVNFIPAGEVRDLVVHDNYLYFSEKDQGVRVFDLRNLRAPRELPTLKEDQFSYALDIQGNYLFQAAWYELYVFDINDPQQIRKIAKLISESGLRAFEMEVRGNYAYLAVNHSDALAIIDVTNPEAPQEVGKLGNSNETYDLALYDQYAYLAQGYKGLSIADVSNPALPTLVTTLELSNVNNVHVNGKYLYVREDWQLVTVYDLSDPANPQKVGFKSIEFANATDVFATGGYFFVMTDQKGLLIFQNDLTVGLEKNVAVAKKFELYQNFPNPFNPTTTIMFELAKTAQVELSVYDLTGRQVRSLVNQILPSGRHWVKWEGNNANGQPAASGLYLYRLRLNGQTVQTRKMILMR